MQSQGYSLRKRNSYSCTSDNEIVKSTPSKMSPRNVNRKRKVSFSEEGSDEPENRNPSPELEYNGPPITYKLYEINGESIVVKKPLKTNVRTRLKRCTDNDISNILNSDDTNFDISDKANKTNTEAEMQMKRNDSVRTPRTSRKIMENVKNNEEIVLNGTNSKNLQKVVLTKITKDSIKNNNETSLKIKLRRSTEQSNYKIQTVSNYVNSDNKTTPVTPKNKESKSLHSHNMKCKFNEDENKIPNEEQSINQLNENYRRSTRIRTPSKLLQSQTVNLRPRRMVHYNENNLIESVDLKADTFEKSDEYRNPSVTDTINLKQNAVDTLHTPRKSSLRKCRERVPQTPQKQNKDGKDFHPNVPVSVETKRLSKNITPKKQRILKSCENEEDHIKDTITASPAKNFESDILGDESLITRTPRRRPNSYNESDIKRELDNNDDVELPRTPKSKRLLNEADCSQNNKQIRNVEKTPKRRLSSKPCTPNFKKGGLTPSMKQRNANIIKPSTTLQQARAKLHVSAVPKSLPCREEEFNIIYTFLHRTLTDKSGGCIYISGVPGTGKTATVNEVIRCLRKLVTKGDLEHFEFVEINGMKLPEPRQVFVQILKQLTGQTMAWEQSLKLLDKKFTARSNKNCMTLLLIDELDLLCNKRQDIVYKLLDWPTKAAAHLVVITIANTMDLPERVLIGRITSRLGLTRLTFQPYNFKQLQEIVMARLKDSDAFRSEAIQLVARKVAAVSGDARRALDICRRATEIAEMSNGRTVSMSDVNEALSEMIASTKVQAIKHCSEMEKTFLQAVCAEVTRTGVEETSFINVYKQLEALCSFDGVKPPNITQALAICGRLGASRLLLCEHSRADIYQRILLNVSSDDIHFSLQNSNV
ncbi:origin recognition complex subunit 1 isoform X2 [Orussus abietinus]|nr:origin recognition complex subunit 1 isoform X2 [Orussus abietinus]XP_012288626.1 origin recognition complex subunit 1 isoform X2 [Orussus abietinus]